MAEAKARGFSIATKCATVEELIEKFRDRVDEESILVTTVESRAVGTECAFALLLADRKVALAGTCVVREVYTDANNPFRRPGMRLGIKRLGPTSQKVFARLLALRIPPRAMTSRLPAIAPSTVARREPLARAPRATPYDVAGHAKRPRPTGASLQVAAEGSANPMLDRRTPEPAPAEPRTSPAAATRIPGSPVVLPANPLTDVPDASLETFVDGRLFDASAPAAPPERRTERPRLAPADAAQILASLAPAHVPAPAEDVARRAARPTVPEPIQRARTARGLAANARAPVPQRLEAQRSEPLPLPPPPPVVAGEPSPVLAAIEAAARANAAAVTSGPTQVAGLPPAGTAIAATQPAPANGPLAARASRRLDRRMLATLLIAPLLGAAALVVYMQLARPAATGTASLPPVTGVELDQPSYARARVEPPPAAATPTTADAPPRPRSLRRAQRGAR